MMKKFIKENWFKLVIIISLMIITSLYILGNRYYFIQTDSMIFNCDKFTGICKQKNLTEKQSILSPSVCDFEIINLVKEGNYYKGLIKNNSEERQSLKAMIAKIYNNDGVLMTSGYESIGDWIEPNKSLYFRIHTFLENDSGLKRDVYPWFSTCE